VPGLIVTSTVLFWRARTPLPYLSRTLLRSRSLDQVPGVFITDSDDGEETDVFRSPGRVRSGVPSAVASSCSSLQACYSFPSRGLRDRFIAPLFVTELSIVFSAEKVGIRAGGRHAGRIGSA